MTFAELLAAADVQYQRDVRVTQRLLDERTRAAQASADNADMSAADPAIGAVAVVNDVTIVPNYCRGIYVGTTGNVAVTMANNDAVTFIAVQAGTVLPIRIKRVNASGTTATSIIALY